MYLNSAEYKELKSMVAYICSITQEMAQNSFDAYTNKDINKAQYIRERDKELDNYTEHAIGYATRTRSKRTWKKASRAMNRAVSKAYQSGKALAKGFFQNLPLF